MDTRTVLAMLCLVWAACEPQPRQAGRHPGAAGTQTKTSQPPPVVAATRFQVAQPLGQLKDSTARVDRLREQAIGIVVPTYGQVTPQELNVINDTTHEIQTIARVRFYPLPSGGWTDTTWTREAGLYTELLRATHEDYGLPVVEKYGRWLRVYYGFAKDGSPRTGWVHLVPGKSVYHDRDRQLFDYSTSLRDPANTQFFDAPDGQPVEVDLRPSYTLQVIRIESDWIQVVLMRPDTSACTGNENFRVSQRDTVWVRRFNAGGKRQLTSAVAGC